LAQQLLLPLQAEKVESAVHDRVLRFVLVHPGTETNRIHQLYNF